MTFPLKAGQFGGFGTGVRRSQFRVRYAITFTSPVTVPSGGELNLASFFEDGATHTLTTLNTMVANTGGKLNSPAAEIVDGATEKAIRLFYYPEMDYQDLVIVFRGTGTVSGSTNPIRQFLFALRRGANDTLISNVPFTKDNTAAFTLLTTDLETWAETDTDPFYLASGGFYPVLANTSEVAINFAVGEGFLIDIKKRGA